MKQVIYQGMVTKKQKGLKSFAVLIDPDKVNKSLLDQLTDLSVHAKVDYLLVGGSLVISNHLDDCIQHIKKKTVIFPSSSFRAALHRSRAMRMLCYTSP